MNTYQDFRESILTNGCYSPEENLRIYNKWFKGSPRWLFRAVDKKYKISDKVVCDVGSNFGMIPLHCGGGSYGIEINKYLIKFAQSIGCTVFQKDLENDDLRDLPKVEAVWFSAVLEHVDCPHIVLRKLHGLLQTDGLLCCYVPTISPFSFLRHVPVIGKYFNGYIHGDHVNAFTPSTIRFMCERAGFKTVEVSHFFPWPLSIFNSLHLIDGVVYIGRKIDGWEYSDNSYRKTADNLFGYISKRPERL